MSDPALHAEPSTAAPATDTAQARQRAREALAVGDHQTAIRHFETADAAEPGCADILLGLAETLALAGSCDEAARRFHEVLALNQGCVPALRGLASLARRQGPRAAVLGYLERIVASAPDNLWFRADCAAELRETGALDASEAAYLDILQRDPEFYQGYRGLGHVERQRGRHADALAHFERALAIAPNDVWVLNEVGIELCELGRVAEADAKAMRLIDLDPNFVHAHRLRAQVARRRGDRASLVVHLRKAADLQPEDVHSLCELAAALREGGDLVEAQSLFERAVAVDPRFVPAIRGLGHLARQRGEQEAALAHFLRARAIAPTDTWSLFELGTQQRISRQLDKAFDTLSEALAADPNFHGARLRRAQVSADLGDRTSALDEAARVLAARPTDRYLRTDLACLLRDLDVFDEAEQAFRSVLDEDPPFVPALRGLAQLQRRQSRHDEARQCLEAAIRLEGATDAGVAELAGELIALGRRDEARQRLGEFLSMRDDAPQCLLLYAQAVAGERPHAERLALLKRAADAGHDFPEATCALARQHLHDGQLAAAEELFASVLSRYPTHLSALLGQGLVARARARGREALECFRTAAATHPLSEGPIVELSRELLRQGRSQEALAVLDAGRARRPGSCMIAMEVGLHHRHMGDHAAACRAFAQVATAFPASSQAQYEVAASVLQTGRLDDAVEVILNLLERDPHHVAAIEMLGDVTQQFDDPQTAILFYDRCMALAPHLYGPALHKARCLARLGRLPAALALLEDVGRRHGEQPGIVLTESGLRKACGDMRAAQTILTRALLFHPEHMPLWSTLAQQSIDLGDWRFVERLLDQVPPHGAQDAWQVHFVRGMLAMSRWEADAAYMAFARAAELHANPHWDHEWAARAALLMADLDRAVRHLDLSASTSSAHLISHAGQSRPSQTFVGQLVEEYRLDPCLCDRLHALFGIADAADDIAAIVRESPDFTPGAVSYIVALRKAGRLALAPARDGPAIPRTIVQFWQGDLPDDVADYCRSWRLFNGDHAYRLFTDADARQFLAQHCQDRVLEAYVIAREPAMKADLFRLAYLSLCGGIYVDCDDVCTAPIAPLLPPGASLVVYQEDLGTIGNNFIAAAPRHPVVCEALRGAVEAILRGDNEIVFLATGPGLLTRRLAAWLAHQPADKVRGLLVHSRADLFACISIHCMASYKHTQQHWSRTAFERIHIDVKALAARVGLAGDVNGTSG